MTFNQNLYPKFVRVGHFSSIGSAPGLKLLSCYYDPDLLKSGEPKRYAYHAPKQTGAYIKPLKASFVNDARLSPMTRLMLIMLAGWDGSGRGGLETTIGTIAENLKRSRRMVFHYLKDAARLGYLSYSRKKNRIGYYIGIRIYLNFDLIRKSFAQKTTESRQSTPESQVFRDVKYHADTKKNILLSKKLDTELMVSLARFANSAGFLEPTLIQNDT